MDERQVNLQHYLSCNIKARILKSRVTKSETGLNSREQNR